MSRLKITSDWVDHAVDNSVRRAFTENYNAAYGPIVAAGILAKAMIGCMMLLVSRVDEYIDHLKRKH